MLPQTTLRVHADFQMGLLMFFKIKFKEREIDRMNVLTPVQVAQFFFML